MESFLKKIYGNSQHWKSATSPVAVNWKNNLVDLDSEHTLYCEYKNLIKSIAAIYQIFPLNKP